jgi:ABC-type molybdate transport system substrate-binding protein
MHNTTIRQEKVNAAGLTKEQANDLNEWRTKQLIVVNAFIRMSRYFEKKHFGKALEIFRVKLGHYCIFLDAYLNLANYHTISTVMHDAQLFGASARVDINGRLSIANTLDIVAPLIDLQHNTSQEKAYEFLRDLTTDEAQTLWDMEILAGE